ncbi:RNA-guided endonuclease InsQ/TnpB family protein [Streptomyces sp. NPDC088246]|uniref:RNA-guided endonuclease InsQ/TnpB family protein n=1 Tax=Streptomyces sp. NPDC088246 TaxID=3365842 RepID=UPI0037F18072
MQLRYQFRLDPTPGQRIALTKVFGCARVVFNDGLALRKQAWETDKSRIPTGELARRVITVAKRTPERAWLAEVSVDALQSAIRDLDAAYGSFFASVTGKRKGPRILPPRFKSKRDNRQSVRFSRNGFRLRGERLNLARVGDVRVRWSRRLPSVPSSATVIRDAAGRFFCSFVVEVEPQTLPDVEQVTGVDLGLGHFAVLSDGTKIDNPRFLRRAEKKLGKEQRDLSRKTKGSSNRAKARVRVARAHARVADARREFHHQLSTRLIRDNQAVAVEDLAVKGLARTRLAKSVHDAGWTQFVAMLEYKAALYGRQFVRAGRFEPTSRVCSACGVKDGPKPLNVRVWTCGACGTALDRDINAAVNVAKAAGLAVTACGAQVRPERVPAPRGETGTHPKGLLSGGLRREFPSFRRGGSQLIAPPSFGLSQYPSPTRHRHQLPAGGRPTKPTTRLPAA